MSFLIVVGLLAVDSVSATRLPTSCSATRLKRMTRELREMSEKDGTPSQTAFLRNSAGVEIGEEGRAAAGMSRGRYGQQCIGGGVGY